eukprot:TRINITY_DN1072_c0_g1_i1.p1 TRINITY_DN1072_c0_g1~~TRINITY_DN1072_c0_g1_i1.p1  ORF type:complete len:310 (-),score=13.80 TRINITY_DN1072_c0_g1_i1:14-943(-)
MFLFWRRVSLRRMLWLLLGLVVFVWIFWTNAVFKNNEQYQVEHLTIAIKDLPLRLVGTKIVQLSDIHFNIPQTYISEEFFDRVIQKTNQLNSDLVVLTGDYVVFEKQAIQVLLPFLQRIRSRLGVFAILGNHDSYQNGAAEMITDALQSIGIRVLDNETVYPLGQGFALAGIGDSKSFNPQKALSDVPPDMPRLVLCHNPDRAENLSRWRVDLQLAGHTHGGQVRLPIFGAVLSWVNWLLPQTILSKIPHVRAFKHWEWTQGLHQVPRTDDPVAKPNLLYVNRGIGTHPPLRLFCTPEITLIELTRAEE